MEKRKGEKRNPIFGSEGEYPEYQGLSDGELIKRWKKGEREAYDDFVRRYGAWVYRNIRYNYNVPPWDSEDVTQEVFIRLLRVFKKGVFDRKTRKYREFKMKKESARGILRMEKYFRSMVWHRKHKEEKQPISIYEPLPSSRSQEDKELRVLDNIVNPIAVNAIKRIMQEEESEIIRKAVRVALEWMPEFCREFIKLFFLEELSYEEISKKTGASKGTLGSRSHRCAPKYRAKLAKVLLQMRD